MHDDLRVILSSAQRVAEIYRFSDREVSRLLCVEGGVSHQSPIRAQVPEDAPKAMRIGKELILLHQNLSGLFGDDYATANRWLRSENTDLAVRPIELLCSHEGIKRVNDYLADYRGKS